MADDQAHCSTSDPKSLDKKSSDNGLIFMAVWKNHELMVETLLKNAVDPNTPLSAASSSLYSKNGGCLLHLAVEKELIEVIKLLLDYGANIHSRDANQRTPFLIAAEKNNLEVMKLLHTYGADIKDADIYGRTALHFTVLQKIRTVSKGTEWFSFNNKTKLVRWLLDAGADINAQTSNNGSTCLHIASYQGLAGVIGVLLEYDVDVNLVNHRNLTALEYALECMQSTVDRSNISATNYHRYRFAKFCMEEKTKTFRVLQEHIHRMHRVGMYVLQQNLITNDGFYEMSRYFKLICEKETAQLMEARIGNTNLTYYYFLSCNIDTAAIMVRNDHIIAALHACDDDLEKFPGYANLIKNRLKKALSLRTLNERSLRLFRHFFEELPRMPVECLTRIASFFSYNERQRMINYYYK